MTPLLLALALSGQGTFDADLAHVRELCIAMLADPKARHFRVNVACKEDLLTWRHAEPQTLLLSGTEKTEVSVRIPQAAATGAFERPDQSFTAGCPVFEQVRRQTPRIEEQISCEALLELDDVATFCREAIKNRTDADPSIVTETPTGERQDFCPGLR